MTPLDLQRMAVRIVRFQHISTHGWYGGDCLEFRNLLPGGRDRRALPDPQALRKMADECTLPTLAEYRLWIAMASRMESLIHNNDSRNPNKMIRDIMHGKFPGNR